MYQSKQSAVSSPVIGCFNAENIAGDEPSSFAEAAAGADTDGVSAEAASACVEREEEAGGAAPIAASEEDCCVSPIESVD